ncbi:ribonuclease T2 [Plodia interpunctella]|uniref:ribonuclease T2 n=1 Tax=Plodia interpunctella TaxID=58824 RepID=UPI002367EAD8|nr:ribonuclease T2 [Plodia interpunctella]
MCGRFVYLFITFLSLDYLQPANLLLIRNVPSTEEHPFDIIIFTQFWPQTVCKEWKEHDSSHTCAMPAKKDSWTIHGIWPTKLGTKTPAFCNRTWLFDPEEIRPIENEMLAMWPNIEVESHYTLWSHEWSKHGTCAAVLEPLDSQFKYFQQGLMWLKKYYIYDILKDAGITPSDSKQYRIEDIYEAVVKNVSARPAIECDREQGANFIVEVRLCFSKTLQIVDCDGIAFLDVDQGSILTNCNPTIGIYYLENAVPKSLYVQFYKLLSWLQWFTL